MGSSCLEVFTVIALIHDFFGNVCLFGCFWTIKK